jgi:23S rRNA (cytidine1920-2'-O)/16S rRNA (cytidine1409-2'-O)-methyltransferase
MEKKPEKPQRLRLDAALVERGFFDTRNRALAAVMAGQVAINGKQETKAGKAVRATDRLELIGETCPYVSRGGFKLKEALEKFDIKLDGRICADIGVATGGFSDCMLQNGAAKVYAVDVGRGQLDSNLAKNPKLVFMGDTNARFLTPDYFPEKPSFVAIDVSFISLKLILGPVMGALARPAQLAVLIKPQFELTPKEVPGGIVKDDACRQRAVDGLREFFASELKNQYNATDCRVISSPIKGAKGNIEYLWLITLGCSC